MQFLFLTLSLASVMFQDTFHCPDGWDLEEDITGCRCFLIASKETVTKEDADILCDFHDGAWVAELDHPGQYSETLLLSYILRSNHMKGINYWLKAKLLASTDIGEYGQFWLGAESQVVTSQ